MALVADHPTSEPSGQDPERYRRLAADLRAAAAECQALSDSMPFSPGKCSSDAARLLCQASGVAERAHWLFHSSL